MRIDFYQFIYIEEFDEKKINKRLYLKGEEKNVFGRIFSDFFYLFFSTLASMLDSHLCTLFICKNGVYVYSVRYRQVTKKN